MLIATVSLPHEAVALEQTLRTVPDLELEAERVAAHSTEWTMPCLWAARADFETVEETLEEDPTVEDIVETHEFNDEMFYQLEWADPVIERINAFINEEGSILEAEGNRTGWRLQIRFASREQFDAFRELLDEQDHSFELMGLTEPGAPRQTHGQVTPNQRDALVAALEHGHFGVPREITADELAATLDISQQALSERLQRGIANLVQTTLITGEDTIEE